MTIKKEAIAGVDTVGVEAPDIAAQLELVNAFSKVLLTEEQVYLFSVRLCDNQVDRDKEYFDKAALEQLAPLFVGKTGIFDHDWSAKNQSARIYRTEIVAQSGVVEETGEAKCFLKGYAYMLRTEENAHLIAEIDAGIKKEVSVSCSVERCICSICQNDIADRISCSHVKGRVYDGKTCVVKLQDPIDAYEWSFVAVPAQQESGVIKGRKKGMDLQKFLSQSPLAEEFREEIRQLQKEADIGRRYMEELRGQVLRLGLLSGEAMKAETLKTIAAKLSEEELLEMKSAYEEKAAKRYPLKPQLSYGERGQEKSVKEDLEYTI